MISLNKIREAIIRQDKELEEMIALYFVENNLKNKKNEKIKVDNELEIYKESFKNNIKKLIESNALDKALALIEEYKKIISDDDSIYSMEGIIFLQENSLELAYDSFTKGLSLNDENIDLLYNMGYINSLLNNKEEAMIYYHRCIELTDDQNLINEIQELIYNLSINSEVDKEVQTFITLDIDKDDILFENINLEDKRVINIIENNKLSYEKQYEYNGITIYEVNDKQYLDIINYLLRNNNNAKIICTNITKYDLLKNLNHSNIIYYTNVNTFTDKNNYVNMNLIRHLENEICNISNIIITNDINVYMFKKIVEERDNVYLFNDISELFDLNNVLLSNEVINENDINETMKDYLKSLEDEYEKSLYLLSSEFKNIDNCIEITKYIYNKYKTEDMYILYLSLLCKKEEYTNLIALSLESKYCDDVIKAELIYLNAIEDYDLIKFINNIQIRDYKNLINTSNENLIYKQATYNFELNQFDISYDKYLQLLSENTEISNSPLVNRNVGYLMYSKENTDYKDFYSHYKELLKCLDISDINN